MTSSQLLRETLPPDPAEHLVSLLLGVGDRIAQDRLQWRAEGDEQTVVAKLREELERAWVSLGLTADEAAQTVADILATSTQSLVDTLSQEVYLHRTRALLEALPPVSPSLEQPSAFGPDAPGAAASGPAHLVAALRTVVDRAADPAELSHAPSAPAPSAPAPSAHAPSTSGPGATSGAVA